jgi:L-asparagine permease
MMAFDKDTGTWTIATVVVVIPALSAGWFLVRRRVAAVAAQRAAPTG